MLLTLKVGREDDGVKNVFCKDVFFYTSVCPCGCVVDINTT